MKAIHTLRISPCVSISMLISIVVSSNVLFELHIWLRAGIIYIGQSTERICLRCWYTYLNIIFFQLEVKTLMCKYIILSGREGWKCDFQIRSAEDKRQKRYTRLTSVQVNLSGNGIFIAAHPFLHLQSTRHIYRREMLWFSQQ